MKRYTALITAILFILVLAGGGAVYLFNTAHAVIDPQYKVPYVPFNSNDTHTVSELLYVGYQINNGNNIYFALSTDYNIDLVCCGFWPGTPQVVGVTNQNGMATIWSSTDGINYTYYDHSGDAKQPSNYPGYYRANCTITNGIDDYPSKYQDFATLDDVMTASIAALDYTPPPYTTSYQFNIPAGYVAYIHLYQESRVNLVCKMPELSKLWISGEQPRFWSGDYAFYNTDISYPDIGNHLYTNIPYIDWERGSDRNAYNQTKTAQYTWTQTVDTVYGDTFDYLVIYNPPYYDLQESNDQVIGPTISVTVFSAIEVKLFSVVNSYVNGTEVSTITKEYDVGPNGEITDPQGNPANPEIGGGNYVPDNSDMNTTVGNLVSDIDEFFNGTWRYIRQLIQSIGTFPQFIVQLYSWLPYEFKGILFSAFSIVIVVAVLKVML